MDVLGSPANQTLLRMVNVKYLIFDKQISMPGLSLIYSGNKTFVYRNENALPRAYFVNRVEKISALDILNRVRADEFDPKDIAFVEDSSLNVDIPDSTAFVKIESYKDETITLNVDASGNNFLFLGDTYFTGEADYKLFKIPTGWKAYIDGNETKIYRANHDFRGIVVPKGKHKVEFVYLPESFVITKYVSLGLSSLALFGLLLGVFLMQKKKKESIEE